MTLDVLSMITLLKLSKTWGMASITTLTIRGLEKSSEFDSCTKLALAAEYKIAHWFQDAVVDILSIPSPSLGEDHISALGGPLVAQLIHAEFQIHRIRMAIALTRPPLVPDGDCPDPTRCTLAWEAMWAATMHAYLVGNPRALHLLGEEFPVMLRGGEICHDCGDQIWDVMVQRGTLLKERATIGVAAGEICSNFGFSTA